MFSKQIQMQIIFKRLPGRHLSGLGFYRMQQKKMSKWEVFTFLRARALSDVCDTGVAVLSMLPIETCCLAVLRMHSPTFFGFVSRVMIRIGVMEQHRRGSRRQACCCFCGLFFPYGWTL